MNLTTKCSANSMDLTRENLDRGVGGGDLSQSQADSAASVYAPSVLEPLNPKLKDSDPFEAACGDVSE